MPLFFTFINEQLFFQYMTGVGVGRGWWVLTTSHTSQRTASGNLSQAVGPEANLSILIHLIPCVTLVAIDGSLAIRHKAGMSARIVPGCFEMLLGFFHRDMNAGHTRGVAC